MSLTAPLTACFEEEKQAKETIRPIAWIKVESSDLSQIRRIPGILKASESTTLSFAVGGKVEKVTANVGDSVKKGDILAKLEANSFNLNMQSTKGQLNETQAILAEAENDFKRQLHLEKSGWVSGAASEKAEASLETAKSRVDVAEAQLSLRKKDLEDTFLRAPYNGKITKRSIEPSQQIVANQISFEIEGQQGLEISVMAPETVIGELNKETVYDTTFPALPDANAKAKIIEISSQAGSANAYPITLSLINPPASLRAGMSAEIDFTFKGRGRTGHKGATVKVPPSALLPGEGQNTYVFVYDETDGTVKKTKVQTENIINNVVLISKGLKTGDILATAGVVYLQDGQKVKLLTTNPKTFN
jgi:multidrug efflux system membrane fusion protein